MGTAVTDNLKLVLNKVSSAYETSPADQRACHAPRLVAVSKTKPVEMIVEAYRVGHRHFGENYIQEICEKSVHPDIQSQCPDIRWHFIGNCQSNKARDLMRCPNLSVIETVTSEKLATKLNNQAGDSGQVSVMVQINTSGEANKNGVEPGEGVKLCQHIVHKCGKLQLTGLMTIGNLGNSIQANHKGENPDFLKLVEVRKEVASALGVQENSLELSMGMSNDFEEAIRMGSTNVRVGSSIFGARAYPKPPEKAADPPNNMAEQTAAGHPSKMAEESTANLSDKIATVKLS